jgi:hypothetical protein
VSATVYTIESRFRPNPAAWVSANDFTVIKTDSIDAALVMTFPNVTLYCLDEVNHSFLFVETPADIDLTQHPFFFQAQFEHAHRLIAVPYETMHQMAAAAPIQGDQLVLLYSVGRCGSTLMSEVFNQLEGVVSLSEPDVFTDILKMREENGRFTPHLKQLLHTSLFALMKPLFAYQPTHWAIKFRSYCVELADLIDEVVPDAKALFMYRNAEDWAQSTARAFQKLESEKGSVGTAVERQWARRAVRMQEMITAVWPNQPPQLINKLFHRIDTKAGVLSQHSLALRKRLFPILVEYENQLLRGELSRMEYITLEWVSAMHKYQQMHEQRMPMLAFRYEDLIEQPKFIVANILDYCGIPAADLDELMQVFDKDSQRGTSLARTAVRTDTNNQLTDTHLDQLRELLCNHPKLATPHVILPGTLNRSERVEG